jgi:hypothetical protein
MDAQVQRLRERYGEARYSLTSAGIGELWKLVDGDRLTERERLTLCLVLNEVEAAARARTPPACG